MMYSNLIYKQKNEQKNENVKNLSLQEIIGIIDNIPYRQAAILIIVVVMENVLFYFKSSQNRSNKDYANLQ